MRPPVHLGAQSPIASWPQVALGARKLARWAEVFWRWAQGLTCQSLSGRGVVSHPARPRGSQYDRLWTSGLGFSEVFCSLPSVGLCSLRRHTVLCKTCGSSPQVLQKEGSACEWSVWGVRAFPTAAVTKHRDWGASDDDILRFPHFQPTVLCAGLEAKFLASLTSSVEKILPKAPSLLHFNPKYSRVP